MTECREPNGTHPVCRVLAPHLCGGPPGHAMPHGCRCGVTWGYPLVTALDRLAFLGLWCRRSGVSEGNIRDQWDEMPDWERAQVYDWARAQLDTLREAA